MSLSSVDFKRIGCLCLHGSFNLTYSYAFTRCIRWIARNHFQVKKKECSYTIGAVSWIAGISSAYIMTGWHPLTLLGIVGASIGVMDPRFFNKG
jgi:hypothetical protein